MSTASHDVYQKLSALGITLPPLAIPAAAYVPFVQTGSLVFLSGHIAKKDGQAWVGQLGKTYAIILHGGLPKKVRRINSSDVKISVRSNLIVTHLPITGPKFKVIKYFLR